MDTRREKTGFAPFLNEMNRLELAQEYAELLRGQNPTATEEQVQQAADKAATLLHPLAREIVLGNLPYLELSTKIDGLEMTISEDPLGVRKEN